MAGSSSSSSSTGTASQVSRTAEGVKSASKIIKPAIDYLVKKKCKKIILGCTELPIAIFAFKSFKKIKSSKTFLDPNLILADAAMRKYNK